MELPPTFMEQVDVIIDNNLSESDLLRLLSKELEASASQVYRKIKQHTGLSPSLYIRQKRLTTAHDWIERSDVPISQIATWAGFQQLPYFSRCFLEEFGYNPSELRKRGGE